MALSAAEAFHLSGYTVITGLRPLQEWCRVQGETGLNLTHTHTHLSPFTVLLCGIVVIR